MKPNSIESLEILIHNIHSNCANLKSAAELLRGASPSESCELLELMARQSKKLARDITDYAEIHTARHLIRVAALAEIHKG